MSKLFKYCVYKTYNILAHQHYLPKFIATLIKFKHVSTGAMYVVVITNRDDLRPRSSSAH